MHYDSSRLIFAYVAVSKKDPEVKLNFPGGTDPGQSDKPTDDTGSKMSDLVSTRA